VIYAVAILVTIAAVLINAVTGFGHGIISIMFFSFVMPAFSAIALTNMLTVTMGAALVGFHVKHIQWRLLVMPVIFSLAAGFLCLHFGASLPETTIKRMLGAFLLLLSLYFVFFNSRVKIKATPLNGAAMGILSGAFNGLFSIGGPPMVLYYLICIDDKSQYMATSQTHFLIVNICMLIMRFFYKQIANEGLILCGIALIPMLGAAWLGTKLFKSLDEKMIRKVIYFFMALCGGYFLIAG